MNESIVGCELPSSVCGVLTTVQQIFLPLMEYFVDPIGLIRVFITNGATLNCTSATNVTNEDDQFVIDLILFAYKKSVLKC